MARAIVRGKAAAAVSNPRIVAAPPVVHMKQLWSDAWQYRPDLELRRCKHIGNGDAIGECELRFRYGSVKSPHESAIAVRRPADLMDWWVRIQFVGDSGPVTSWVGRIAHDAREVYRTGDNRSGIQTFVAHEPLWELQRRTVSTSTWWDAAEDGGSTEFDERVIGWVPSINRRDRHGVIVGNRSDEKHGSGEASAYLYGSEALWTHHDYVDYLLRRHLDEHDGDYPIWRLGGQASLLQNLRSIMPIGDGESIAEIVRKLIHPRFGVDYRIIPIGDQGFELNVYALVGSEQTFAGATLPKNPNVTNIQAGSLSDQQRVSVVRTGEYQFPRIRVNGARIVVCFSLEFLTAESIGVKGWSDTIQSEYGDGTGSSTDDAAEHDDARRADRFRSVYAELVVRPFWDHAAGLAALRTTDDGLQVQAGADFQNLVRETLPWLPLKAQVPYGPEGAGQGLGSLNHEGGQLPAFALLYDEEKQRYILAEDAGVNVHVLSHDFGIRLGTSPNHLLALNTFNGETEREPVYDYRKVLATIAMESDQRLRLIYESGVGDGETHPPTVDISDDDAELWYVVPGTVVGLDWQGRARRTSGPLVLRNDASRLAMVMAGAIARYRLDRVRAEISAVGLLPVAGLVGTILGVIDQGLDTQFVNAPITEVEWVSSDNPDEGARTIVKTGYAR